MHISLPQLQNHFSKYKKVYEEFCSTLVIYLLCYTGCNKLQVTWYVVDVVMYASLKE